MITQEDHWTIEYISLFPITEKVRQYIKQVTQYAVKSYLKIILRCQTLSKVLDISKETLLTPNPSSNEWQGLNPDCFWVIRLFSKAYY